MLVEGRHDGRWVAGSPNLPIAKPELAFRQAESERPAKAEAQRCPAILPGKGPE